MSLNKSIVVCGVPVAYQDQSKWGTIVVKKKEQHTIYLGKWDVFNALMTSSFGFSSVIWNTLLTFREQNSSYLKSIRATHITPEQTDVAKRIHTGTTSIPKEPSNSSLLPQFDTHTPQGQDRDNLAAVQILNARGYYLNGTFVPISKAERTVFISAQEFQTAGGFKPLTSFINCGTRNAILNAIKNKTENNKRPASPIVLNFANAEHACGGPGFYWSKEQQQYVYNGRRAGAQEENLTAASNFADSIMPYTFPENDVGGMVRSWFHPNHEPGFDSRKESLISHNLLFMNDTGHLLATPLPFTMLTSAAGYHGHTLWNEKTKPLILADAEKRILAHLRVAALQVKNQNEQEIFSPVILGAFGCGAFAPQGHNGEYSRAVAQIYKKLLNHDEFNGAFPDGVTFAVIGCTTDWNAAAFRETFAYIPTVVQKLANHRRQNPGIERS